MTEVWFIGDTHFGHKNILEYEKEARPFQTIEEMNDAIIDKWNNVVNNNDIVYHLGDVAFGRHNISHIGRCKGRKRLVLGNHDTYPVTLYLEFFEKVYGCVFYNRCVLSHIPVHPDGLGERWLINIHGHLHSRSVKRDTNFIEFGYTHIEEEKPRIIAEKINDEYYFNVSCEQNNLTPINWEVIKKRIKEL